MDNFSLGILSIIANAQRMFTIVAANQLFIGFAAGFFIASLIYGVLSADNIRHVPTLLFRKPSDAFTTLYQGDTAGTYHTSFSSFTKTVDKVQLFFVISVVMLLVLILVAMVTFWYTYVIVQNV